MNFHFEHFENKNLRQINIYSNFWEFEISDVKIGKLNLNLNFPFYMLCCTIAEKIYPVSGLRKIDEKEHAVGKAVCG